MLSFCSFTHCNCWIWFLNRITLFNLFIQMPLICIHDIFIFNGFIFPEFLSFHSEFLIWCRFNWAINLINFICIWIIKFISWSWIKRQWLLSYLLSLMLCSWMFLCSFEFCCRHGSLWISSYSELVLCFVFGNIFIFLLSFFRF